MLKRACFLTNYNQYDSKRHFSEELARAMQRQGVETAIFDAEDPEFRKNPKFKIEEFAPDITLSFNSFAPNEKGQFLFDWLEIPHLSMLLDPALYYMDMAASPYCHFSVVDQFDVDALKGFGKTNVFFLPHGARRGLADETPLKKEYDVVFVGSSYDYLSLREYWKNNLSSEEVSILETAAEIFLNDNATPLYAALTEAINLQGSFPQGMDFMRIFRFLDIYTRGFDRVQLIRSLKDVNVHIFGGTCEGDLYPERSWKEFVSDMPNVHVHGPLGYEATMDVLKKSKISLNSSPFFKNGSHERLFVPPLVGALVASNDTLYTRREFVDGKDILLYPPKGWELLNERIFSLLKDESKLHEMATSAKKKVLDTHTWDERAKTLINETSYMIRKSGI